MNVLDKYEPEYIINQNEKFNIFVSLKYSRSKIMKYTKFILKYSNITQIMLLYGANGFTPERYKEVIQAKNGNTENILSFMEPN